MSEFTSTEIVAAISAIPKVIIAALSQEPALVRAALLLNIEISDDILATALAAAATAEAAAAAAVLATAGLFKILIDTDGQPYMTDLIAAGTGLDSGLDLDGTPYVETA